MIDVSHIDKATKPLSAKELYDGVWKIGTKPELLAYLCSLIEYYRRAENLSSREAGTLASQMLLLLAK